MENLVFFSVPPKSVLRDFGIKDISSSRMREIGDLIRLCLIHEIQSMENNCTNYVESSDYKLMQETKSALADWVKDGRKPLKLVDKIMRPILETPSANDSSVNLVSRRWLTVYERHFRVGSILFKKEFTSQKSFNAITTEDFSSDVRCMR
jgi:hypothetical protein